MWWRLTRLATLVRETLSFSRVRASACDLWRQRAVGLVGDAFGHLASVNLSYAAYRPSWRSVVLKTSASFLATRGLPSGVVTVAIAISVVDGVIRRVAIAGCRVGI